MTDDAIKAALKQMHDAIGFDHKAHKYAVDGVPYISVTTALKALDKPALVPWASKLQQEADKAVVEEWARSGAFTSLDAALKSVAHAWRKKRDTAADLGTQAHALIEHASRTMLGLFSEEPEVSDEARYIFAGWQEWADRVQYRPLATETRVFHREHQYAGTVDVVARFGAMPYVNPEAAVVCDWKSSRGLFPEHRLQSAAYRAALEAAGIETAPGVVVVLPKDKPGAVKPYVLNDDVDALGSAMPAFLGALAAYRWLQAAA